MVYLFYAYLWHSISMSSTDIETDGFDRRLLWAYLERNNCHVRGSLYKYIVDI